MRAYYLGQGGDKVSFLENILVPIVKEKTEK